MRYVAKYVSCVNDDAVVTLVAVPEHYDLEHLVLVGAGSNSSVWSQILADILNVPIEVRSGVGTLDVSARGNAMIGEVALDSAASLQLPSNVRHVCCTIRLGTLCIITRELCVLSGFGIG